MKENTKSILSLIRKRRSIRKFSDKKIKRPDLNKILEAGRWAPSGLNNQPWRFLVVDDKNKIDRLSEFTKYGYILRKASVLIVVCIDIGDCYNREKDIMATGAAIQNMLLEASSIGIGSCWMGEILNKQKEVQNFLGLHSDLELLAVIPLGYPAHKPKSTRKQLKHLLIQ